MLFYVLALGTPRSAVKDVLDKVQPSGKASFGTPAYKRLFLKQRDTVTRELFELYNKTVFNDKVHTLLKCLFDILFHCLRGGIEYQFEMFTLSKREHLLITSH